MSGKKRKSGEKTSAEVFGAANMAKLPTNNEEFTMEVREASPAHLLMKIRSFSLLSKPCESPEFEAGDYKWRLIIHPNGLIKSENDEDNYISVYLSIVENREVNAAFSIFLYNHVLENYLCFQGKMRRFNAMKNQWGFSKLISKGSLRAPGSGFLVDDTCVFGVEVAVVKTQPIVQCVIVRNDIPYKRDFKISSFSKLEYLWYSEAFTVGDHKWKIELYPNGYTSQEGRSVSLYLYLVDAESFASHKKVKADYYLRIKNQLNDHQHFSRHVSLWFTSSSFSWGWHAFIPLSDMRDSNKGFVVNDCFIVEVEMSVKAIVS